MRVGENGGPGEWVGDMNTVVRIAEPDDAMAVARVHVNAWRMAYRTLLPAAYLDGLRPEERAARYDFSHSDPLKPRTIVATSGGDIAGFATIAPAQDFKGCGWGELCALYVDPACWGQGVGRTLVATARSYLAEAGFQTAVLWIVTGNVRADRFYRRDGWTPDGVDRRVPVWGITIDEVRYSRPLRALAGARR
jgi:GNAT superfamily N-acetyltransferase